MVRQGLVVLAIFIFQICEIWAQEDLVLTSTILEYEFSSPNDSIPINRERNYHLESDTSTHIHITALWDEGLRSWVNSSKSIGVYDREANSLEMRNYYQNGNDWTGSMRYVFWYGSNTDISQYRLDTWNPSGSNWLKRDSLSERWEQDSLVKISEEFIWSENNQVWDIVDGDRIEIIKTNEGVISSEHHSKWDSDMLAWIPYSQASISYDHGGNIEQKIIEFWIESGAYWYEYFKHEFYYDDVLGMQIEERFEWNFWSSDWSLKYRSGVSTIDIPGMSYILGIKNDNLSRWQIYEQVSSEVDERQLVIRSTVETKFSEYGDWENKSQTRNFYNEEKQPLWVVNSNWSEESNSYVVKNKKFYYYPEPIEVQVKDYERNDLGYRIFPNPATDRIIIDSPDGFLEAYVFDLQGRMLKYSEVREIDVSGFSAGLYFVRIISQDGRDISLRFIKM